MEMKKVTMNLTPKDVLNTEVLLSRLHARNKASVVSSALAITEAITSKVSNGGEILIKNKDGSMETVIIAGLGDG